MDKLDYLHEIFSSPARLDSPEFREWLRNGDNRKLFERVFAQREAILRTENIPVDVEAQLAKVLAAAGADLVARRSKGRIVRRLLIPAATVATAAVLLLFVLWQPESQVEPQLSVVTVLTDDGRIIHIENDTHMYVDGAAVSGESIRYGPGDGDTPVAIHTLAIPVGHTYRADLSDGTVVWLNAGSRLRFPTRFADDLRRVHLEGEALFEVTHDPERPFVVETTRQELTVLGTEFNVFAYPDDAATTTLLSGSVSVRSFSGDGGRCVLTPGEQATLDSVSGEYTVREVSAHDFTAWKDGVFVVENNTLEQVMNKLSRWYGIEVAFSDPDAKDIVFQGSIPQLEQVLSVLKRIEEISPARFDIKSNKVRVSMIR